MFGLGTPELLLILGILLVLFGGTQIPKLANSLGGGMRELTQGRRWKPAESADSPTSRRDSSQVADAVDNPGWNRAL